MCGRYSLFTPPEDIEQRFGASFAEEFQPRYNAAPSQSLPVITDASPKRIDAKEWGFVPPWADSRSDFGFINARAETLTEKSTFRDAFAQQSRDGFQMGRCLVPADGFYEWQDTRGGKQPYRVERTDGEPFAMAGLFERRETEGRTEVTVTVVTTEPNAVVEPLHHRMAAVFDPDEEDVWLSDADPTTHRDLLDPSPAAQWRSYPVSTRVNDPTNDDPGVIEAVTPEQQTGLGDFE